MKRKKIAASNEAASGGSAMDVRPVQRQEALPNTIEVGGVEYPLAKDAPWPPIFRPDSVTECRIAGDLLYISFASTMQDGRGPVQIAVDFRLRLPLSIAERVADLMKSKVSQARQEGSPLSRVN